MPEPLPVETVVDGTGDVPAETTVVVAPTDCPEVVVPTGNTTPGGPLTEEDGKIFFGLCEADAQAVADGLGYTLRVVRLDGEDLAVTMDFVEWRVNVAIENGIVTDVVSFG